MQQQENLTKTLKTWQSGDTAMAFDIAETTRQSTAAQTAVTEVKSKGNWLTRTFNRWTKLPKLEKELTAKQEELERFQQRRRSEALTCFTNISDIVIADDAVLKTQLESETKTQNKTTQRKDKMATLTQTAANAMRALKRAYKEADEAADMELVDAFTGNSALDLLSHFETDEAIDAIKAAKKSVETLNDALDTEEALMTETALQNMRDDNNFDLIIDCFSDIMGAFTSLNNREKLKKAMEQISETHTQVENIHTKLSDKTRKLEQEIAVSSEKIQQYRRQAMTQTTIMDNDALGAYTQLNSVLQTQTV